MLMLLVVAGLIAPPFYAERLDLLWYIDAAGQRQPIRFKEDWARRRQHILENFQRVAGALPDRDRQVALDVQVLEETRLDRITRRRISFVAEPGDRIFAYLFLPVSPTAKAPAVLCLHQTTRIGKAEPAGLGGKSNLHYALELAQRGYATLAPDYPGFGDSQTDPYKLGYASATMKGILNHRRAVDLLQSLPEVATDHIGCIGHSLGGHNSIFVALFDDRIKAVATSCGFNAFPRYYGGNLKGWGGKNYMPRITRDFGNDPLRVPFDFPELLAALAPRPVFINAPLHDANFEVSGVRDCVAAARPVYKLLGVEENLVARYPDAEHDFPSEVRQKAYEFFDFHLNRRSHQ